MALFKKRFKAPRLDSMEHFLDLVDDGKPVLVDFVKQGCQPCRVMDGIVDEVADEFQDDAIVVKADLERVPDLFGKFKVRSTPTFVLVTPQGNGLHQRWRQSGLVKKDVLTGNVQRAVDAT